MKNEQIPKSIDLLIIDIDDSFIYHRTVAAANKLFLNTIKAFFGIKREEKRLLTTSHTIMQAIKIVFSFNNLRKIRIEGRTAYRFIILSGCAIFLHLLNLIREAYNFIGGSMSNNIMIEAWARTLEILKISRNEYHLGKETIRKSIYPEMLRLFKRIKEANPNIKVVAISESFSIKGKTDPIISILGIDFMESNILHADSKGRIARHHIKIKNRNDKKRIAESIIIKTKPKSIGIIIGDYEDLGLLSLENISLVAYTPEIKRFIDKEKYPNSIEVHV